MKIDNPIIEKIKKLLALASSTNEHEAALAASHAQRLLSEHNLAMADIESAQKPQSADKVEAQVSKTLPKWLRFLVTGVNIAFDCQAIHSSDGTLTFIGVGADVQVAAYTFSYLDKTVRRLCSGYMKQHADGDISNRNRELRRQSYYLGAAITIAKRLKEQRQITPTTPGALVPVKDALIKKAMSEYGPTKTIRGRKSYVDMNAYNKGQQDGHNVGINKGIGGGTESRCAIG